MPNTQIPLELIPAQGQTFKTKQQAIESWRNGDVWIQFGLHTTINERSALIRDFGKIVLLYGSSHRTDVTSILPN